MRFAILGSRGFPSTYGGFETFVRRAAPEFVRRGSEVVVYCRSQPETLRPRRRTWTIDGVQCIWTPGRDTATASTLTFGLSSHVDAACRSFDAALVLNVANGLFIPLLKRAHIPVVLNTDGLEWTRGKWGRGARRVFYSGAKLSARYADVLVSDSKGLQTVWADTFDAGSVYIPYGADVIDVSGSSRIEKLGLAAGDYVLVVARLVPENNVPLTLDALDCARDVRAVIVGSAAAPSALESRLQEMSVSKRVLWLGHVADQELLTELWANAGLYVHGHSVGGTNPALLQALGAGAPTIALDTAFNREVLRNDGQLFPADARTLADLITNALADSDLRETWSASGKSIVGSRYQWSAVIDAYLEILQRAAHHAPIAEVFHEPHEIATH